MNEFHFAYRVRQQLNRGLNDLSPRVADRLAAARSNALLHQKQAVPQTALALAGNFLTVSFEGLRRTPVFAALTALLLAAFIVYTPFWIADRRVAELSEIDGALLADELPIDAFTDKGFRAWLTQTSPE